MMGQKQSYNKGPIGSYGSSTGPASGYLKPKPSSPFDDLVKPKPKFKLPKGTLVPASDIAREEGRYVPAADKSRSVNPNTSRRSY